MSEISAKQKNIIIKPAWIALITLAALAAGCAGRETPLAALSASDPPSTAPRILMVDPALDAEGPFGYLAKSSISLAGIASNQAAQLTFDGAIYTGGAELVFLTGDPPRPAFARARHLLDGWIPIVSFHWREGEVFCEIETFALPLTEDPLSPTVVFAQARLTNTGARQTTAHFAAATRFRGEDHRFGGLRPFPFSPDWTYEIRDGALIRDGKLILLYPREATAFEAVPGESRKGAFAGRELSITERAEVGVARLGGRLGPGESRSFVFRVPVAPLDLSAPGAGETLRAIRAADYGQFRARAEELWRARMRPGATLLMPERKVLDTHRASLMFTWQAIWQRDGQWIQGVNKFQYRGFWLRDGAYILAAYDSWGHHDVTRRLLEVYPRYQTAGGLFSSYPGQFDGFGQALYILGRHALFTGDTEWARQAALPLFPPAFDWLRRARAGDPFALMPATDVQDNEFIRGHYTGHNLWALLGIRTAIRAATEAGAISDARIWRADYESLRAAFLERLAAAAGGEGPIPPGLDTPGGQDWGNLIALYPTEVLDPHDPRVTATLEKVRREKVQEGLMTYMGRLHHYLTVKEAQNYVARDEQELALERFYAILLHTGSAHEMFEWQAEPWGDRDVDGNFPPHGWGAAMFNLLLRNMLVMERGGGGGLGPRELHFFSAISPAWAEPGSEIGILRAPTELGPVSFTLRFDEQGARFRLDPAWRAAPSRVVFHIPYFIELESFEADAPALERSAGALIFDPGVREVRLNWRRREGAREFSYHGAVEAYRAEYARRYAEYRARGGEPAPVEPPPLLSARERREDFQTLYGAPDAGIAAGKPARASGAIEFDHGPDRAVDGDARDAEASSCWLAPPAPQWIEVDLLRPERIGSVRVFPYWDGSRYYQYVVEVSPDGAQWIRVGDRSRNTRPSTALGDLFEFPPVHARFVRVTMLYNSANTSLHLVELRVYPAK